MIFANTMCGEIDEIMHSLLVNPIFTQSVIEKWPEVIY